MGSDLSRGNLGITVNVPIYILSLISVLGQMRLLIA